MPLPLAPLLPLALRLGAFALAGYAARRLVAGRSHPGRTDQRMEDALDDVGEGVTVHRPADRNETGLAQTNSTARLRRTVQIAGHRYEVDAAIATRFRIRKG
ncbi:MAG: hypothetical protein U1E06_00390 [Tabrizicola sp.]|nr:hypothetical protein [Tabrizicola sp.]MDZ4065307.1 hypothetical protein [Tabrizicola sp.]